MADKVELYVNGKIYSGWLDVDITRSLNAISGSFSMSVTDRWSGQSEPWIVKPDDACEVKINGERVIKGYIFSVDPSFNKDGRTIAVAGRDSTADFVDCSIDVKENQLQTISLKRLAETLAKPFGLKVTIEGSTGAAFNPFAFNPGESCFEALERACRQKGFLLTNDGNGGILMTRPSSERSGTILEQGKNILQASGSFNHTERFSNYKVKGQSSKFEDDLDPMFAYSIQASATDPNVPRYRPLLVVNESVTTIEQAKQRAQWEATNRAAKSSQFNVQVQGWTQGDGSLWRVNQLVRLRSHWIGVDDDLLVVSTKMTLSASSGSLTELKLERKDAYTPEPAIPKKTDPLEAALKKAVAPK